MAGLALWCGMGGTFSFPTPEQESEISEFVSRCASVGIKRLFPTIVRGDYAVAFLDMENPARTFHDYYEHCQFHPLQVLVREAHRNSIEVHPYLAINDHGCQWPPKSDSLVGEFYPLTFSTRFALAHPELRCSDRAGRDSFQLGRELRLSHAHPAVRQYEVQYLVNTVRTYGLDGIQLEFVSEPVDEAGYAALGYEKISREGFLAETGRDPRQLPSDDESWLRYRAGHVTRLIRELRTALRDAYPSCSLSVSFAAGSHQECLKRLIDWPTWVVEGLVDEICLWYLRHNQHDYMRWLRDMRTTAGKRCQITAEISCYHRPGSADKDFLTSLARDSLSAGADQIGIYRADSVQMNELWPVMATLAEM